MSKELSKYYTILVITAICFFGVLNTVYLSHRIQNLEEKIESIKPIKIKK